MIEEEKQPKQEFEIDFSSLPEEPVSSYKFKDPEIIDKVSALLYSIIDIPNVPKLDDSKDISSFIYNIAKICDIKSINPELFIKNKVGFKYMNNLADRKAIRRIVYDLIDLDELSDGLVNEVASAYDKLEHKGAQEMESLIQDRIERSPELIKLRNKVDVKKALSDFPTYMFNSNNDILALYNQAVEAAVSTNPEKRSQMLEEVIVGQFAKKAGTRNFEQAEVMLRRKGRADLVRKAYLTDEACELLFNEIEKEAEFENKKIKSKKRKEKLSPEMF